MLLKGWLISGLITTIATVYPDPVIAQPTIKASRFCQSRNFYTVITFSSPKYNVAICQSRKNRYYYIGQNRKDNAQLFLPITEMTDPNRGANPWILKAHNKNFTYQIAEFDPGNYYSYYNYVSLSVFQNGKKIYHWKSTNYSIGPER